jgi:type II secretory pathway pseudopilin PulG
MSLMEVIVAMAIFLMSLTAISRLVDLGTEQAVETKFQSTGTRLAQSKLAEVEAGAIAITGGSGDFSDSGEEGWQWSVESQQDQIPNLYLITVTVSRDYGGKLFEVKMSQYLMDPLVMGTGAEAQPPEPAVAGGDTTGSGME